MTLESQMPRTTTWRTRGGKSGPATSGTSGPDRRLIAILVGAAIVAVSVGVIYFMGGKKPTTPDVAQGNLGNGSALESSSATPPTSTRRELTIQDPTAKPAPVDSNPSSSPAASTDAGKTPITPDPAALATDSAAKTAEINMGAPPKDPAGSNPSDASAPAPGADPGTSLSPAGTGPTEPLPASDAQGPPPEVRDAISNAERATRSGDLAAARTHLNAALHDSRLADAERGALRAQLADIADKITFAPAIARGDPLAREYTIKSGDSLTKVASAQGLAVDWRLLQRVNRIKDPSKISVGQKIKLVQGPFHAVVDKSDFRLDLYAGEPLGPGQSQANPAGPEPGWVFIRSFSVGLGAKGGTPIGYFVVKPRSKLVNPHWVNPKTGEKFAANDPKNPIGEYWIGIEGADESSRASTGFGIHGTIEPDSIGREMSMGCVRMGADDVALMYECLVEKVSVVKIVP